MNRIVILKKLYIVIVILLLVWTIPVQSVELITSPNDSRQYELLTLENKLRVLLISDPDTDKAAASLDVNSGYFNDPADRAGLTHFLEHMLFLGTKKYPSADEYMEFISSHGGRNNAYTADEHTNYFFDIDKDFLDPALDRFAQFFIAPLFNEEYVQREMNAVESEYRLKIKDDSRRYWEVIKTTSNPRHPFSKFSVGNLTTLADRDGSKSRDELIKLYHKHYSANIMTLTVLGKEPLSELKKQVQRFSAIPNSNIKPGEIEQALFTQDQQGVRINIVPLQNNRSLTMVFLLPWKQEYYLQKPTQLLAYLLGHEGGGSLYSVLKDKGWINALSAGNGLETKNAATFEISFDLTENGLKHIDDISILSFQAINMIKKTGIEQWRHDEIRNMNELNFRFREKGEPSSEVVSLSSNLHIYPENMVIKGPYYSGEFDKDLVLDMIERLTPDNMRMVVTAKELNTSRIEPLYNTPYDLEKLTAKFKKKLANAGQSARLSLPKINPFIPEDTDLVKDDTPDNKPRQVVSQPGLSVWHQQDSQFLIPKSDIFITLQTAHNPASIEDRILLSLYSSLVNDALNEFAYPAYLAGLKYSVSNDDDGFSLSIGGYNDKQQVLIDKIMATLTGLTIKPDRFSVKKDKMIENWQNSHLDRPYRQVSNALSILLSHNNWTADSYLEAISAIDHRDLQKFAARLFKQFNLELLAHGNISEQEITNIATAIFQSLTNQAEIKPWAQDKVIKVEHGGGDSGYRYAIEIEHNDSSLICYYQADDDSTLTQAKNLLLMQIMQTPFFNQLRTEKQLGYVVYVAPKNTLRVPGLQFVIQSPTANPDLLLANIDEFLAQAIEDIKLMDSADFSRHQQAIMTLLLEKDKKMSERSYRYRKSLSLKYDQFDQHEKIAEAVNNLSKQEIIEYYSQLLVKGKSRRIAIQSTGDTHQIKTKAAELDHQSIESFRNKQPAFSL